MSDTSWTTTVPESRDPSTPRKVSLHDALAPGTRLDEFEIRSVLGIGAFGIVYLADDHILGRCVAVKEYMPAMLAGRREQTAIAPRSPEFAAIFERGLDSFLREARLLASFDHPSLVKVHRFWQGNGTAYMAMQYHLGATLKDVRLAMAAPPEGSWLLALAEPLLDALALLHGQGVFHRDISPDNIVIAPGGRPVLLDFGSARRVIGEGAQFLSAVLKPSFAPLEQYAAQSELRQGAWTDLYALGATLHFALTGRAPTPSVVRAVDDVLPVLACSADAAVAALPKPLLATIDWMLAMAPDARPRDVDTVRRALRGEIAVPPVLRAAAAGDRGAVSDLGDVDDVDDGGDAEATPAAGSSSPVASTAAKDDEAPAAAATSGNAPVSSQRASATPAMPSPLDPRRAVVALGLLGVVIFAGGAWTLNRTGAASPALASLAAALHAPSSASHAKSDPEVRAAPVIADAPALSVASSPRSSTVAGPEPVGAGDGEATLKEQAARAPIADTKPLRRDRVDEHARRQSRPPDPARPLQLQNVSTRTKSTLPRAAAGCGGLSAFSRMLCTLRECKSPATAAQSQCAHARQVELARQERMERE
jgi:hypothetical protein